MKIQVQTIPNFVKNFYQRIRNNLKLDSSLLVIVSTYNHEKYIIQCLNSIANQSLNMNFKVLIHDDCSTDSTSKLVKGYIVNNSLKWIHIIPESNRFAKGEPILSNLILKSSSKYIAIIDGDDYWISPHKLEQQLDFMEKNTWCAISHHDIEVIFENNVSNREKYKNWLNQDLRNTERVSGKLLFDHNWILTSTVMLRRKCLDRRLLSQIHNQFPRDWLIFAIAGKQGDVGFIRNLKSAYRIHSNNLWANLSDSVQTAYQKKSIEFINMKIK